MSTQLAQAIDVTGTHLDPRDVAAYVDRLASPTERARIESHLATCAECRAEVTEAAQIIDTLPRGRGARRAGLISAAGIAAMLLVFIWPRADRQIADQQHRETGITTTITPQVLGPAGTVEAAKVFTWSSVPHADRYELRVFDSDGGVVWESATTDTAVILPPTITLRAGRSYYWKVQAQTGFDRSASTDLVEFSIRPRQ
jgi:hypothetical protein